jgi:sec-independent protein translocase protein TatA
MPNVGPLEIAVVLIIALVIFGPKRIPELGHSLGKGLREFKGSLAGKDDEHDETEPEETDPQQLPSGASAAGIVSRDRETAS